MNSNQPFSTQQGLECGLTRHQLQSTRFRRLYQGVYIPAEAPLTLATWLAAATLVLPRDAQITGATALAWHGVRTAQPLPITAVTAQRRTSRRAGIRLLHRHAHRALAAIAPPVEALQVACELADLLSAITMADEALTRGLVASDEMLGWQGQHLRAVARWARVGPESARETWLRLVLVLAGLPEPELQVNLGGADGWIGRVDAVLRDYGVVLEYEGDQHRAREQWGRDIQRYEALDRSGFLVIRVVAEHVREPWAVVNRVHDALRARGYRGPKPRPSGQWCALFAPPRSLGRATERGALDPGKRGSRSAS